MIIILGQKSRTQSLKSFEFTTLGRSHLTHCQFISATYYFNRIIWILYEELVGAPIAASLFIETAVLVTCYGGEKESEDSI